MTKSSENNNPIEIPMFIENTDVRLCAENQADASDEIPLSFGMTKTVSVW